MFIPVKQNQTKTCHGNMKVAQVNGYQFALEIQWEFRTQHGNIEPAISTFATGGVDVHRECKFIYALYKAFEMCNEEVNEKST